MGDSKVAYLDGLRGIVCLMVACHHFACAFRNTVFRAENRTVFTDPFSFLNDGELDIIIFFMISGRVIADSFRKKPDPRRLVSAMVRRAFRLGIPIFFYFQVVWIMNQGFDYLKMIDYGNYSHIFMAEGEAWPFVLPVQRSLKQSIADTWSLFTTYTINDRTRVQAGVLWTIPIEFRESFAVYSIALICAYLGRMRWLFLALVTIMLLPAFENIYTFFLGYLLSEIESTDVFKWVRESGKLFSPKWWILKTIKLLMLYKTLIILCYRNERRVIGAWMSPLMIENATRSPECGATAFLLLTTIAITPEIQWLLSTQIFQFLGDISFSLYLLHGTMLPVAQVVMAKMVLAGYTKFNAFMIALSCFYIPFSCLLAHIFNRLIDKPSTRIVNNAFKYLVRLFYAYKDGTKCL